MRGDVAYSYNAGRCICGGKTCGEVARGETPSHQICVLSYTIQEPEYAFKNHYNFRPENQLREEVQGRRLRRLPTVPRSPRRNRSGLDRRKNFFFFADQEDE
jgi:hypothetical protein